MCMALHVCLFFTHELSQCSCGLLFCVLLRVVVVLVVDALVVVVVVVRVVFLLLRLHTRKHVQHETYLCHVHEDMCIYT